MTAQTAYWEPGHTAVSRPHRWAVAMGLLVAALVIGILYLFLIPSGKSIQTLVLQQPTQTPAEIAKLYVEELWGKGNTDLAKVLISSDFVDHDPMFVNKGSRAGTSDKNNGVVFANNVKILRNALPDITVSTDNVIEGGDQVVVRWTFTGTHTQPFLTYPRTDKSITITNTDILRIVNGQIVERWGRNQLQALKDAAEIVEVSPSAAQAVTAFARFAYIYSAGKVEDLGAAFTDEVKFNDTKMTLKDFETSIDATSRDSGGITNIRMISGYVIGDRLTLKVEFDTNKGAIHNNGTVIINLKDGKIATYDYYGP